MSADKNRMPTSREFTDEELERFVTELWPQLPSYRAEDRSLASSDLPKLFVMMNWPRTESQNRQYIVFVDKVWGGRITFPDWRGVMLNVHDRMGYLRWTAETLDTNGDGYISKEEYEFGMDLITAHEPTLGKISYEQLMEEADTNKDGLISIQEMIDWLGTKDQRVKV